MRQRGKTLRRKIKKRSDVGTAVVADEIGAAVLVPEELDLRGLLVDKSQNSVLKKQMRRTRMSPVKKCSNLLSEALQSLINSSGRFR
jgi:hypothetical protein